MLNRDNVVIHMILEKNTPTLPPVFSLKMDYLREYLYLYMHMRIEEHIASNFQCYKIICRCFRTLSQKYYMILMMLTINESVYPPVWPIKCLYSSNKSNGFTVVRNIRWVFMSDISIVLQDLPFKIQENQRFSGFLTEIKHFYYFYFLWPSRGLSTWRNTCRYHRWTW